jgi:hypothetical protein
MRNYLPDIDEDDTIPDQIWTEVYGTLDQVSDEVGQEEISNRDILKFKGWSPNCFWDLQKKGIFNEDAYIEYAEICTKDILYRDWAPQMAKRRYKIIQGGYIPGALYGITWAIFRRYPAKLRKHAKESRP